MLSESDYFQDVILQKTLLVTCFNYVHHNVWDEITYPFPNLNGTTIEVW